MITVSTVGIESRDKAGLGLIKSLANTRAGKLIEQQQYDNITFYTTLRRGRGVFLSANSASSGFNGLLVPSG